GFRCPLPGCGGPPKASGIGRTRPSRTTLAGRRPGCMPICTESKATLAMPDTGIARPASRPRPVRLRRNGQRSPAICLARSDEDRMTAAANSKLIKGATGDWEVIVGMEVHAQVTSRAKLFSGASTEFGGPPNSHVSLVDAAMPGMPPVINEECVRQAIRTGLGLRAKINLKSVFDRKNYFYPDLPQGYQISQYKS